MKKITEKKIKKSRSQVVMGLFKCDHTNKDLFKMAREASTCFCGKYLSEILIDRNNEIRKLKDKLKKQKIELKKLKKSKLWEKKQNDTGFLKWTYWNY
jgi:hypothetical protein